MTLYQLWDPTVQFQTVSGKNLVNGHVKVTYLDRTQLAPVYDFDGKAIQNPVTLDANGRAAVYVEVDKLYTIHVYDQNAQLVYTQNIREYPKDMTVTIPTIVSTESIDATLSGDTYTLDVKDSYIKKFASNTTVLTYGQTPTQSFADLTQLAAKGLLYAKEADGLGAATIYQATAWGRDYIDFTAVSGEYGIALWTYSTSSGWSSYINDTRKVASQAGQTPDYLGNVIKAGQNITVSTDGAFVKIDSTASGGSANVILTYGVTPTQTFSQLTQLAAKGLLYAQSMTTVLQATSWSSTDIEFHAAHSHYIDTWKYSVNTGWSSSIEDTAKVSVDNGSTPGYLEDVLTSDNDIISVIKSNGKLYLHADTNVTSDPKIQTLDEFVINSATSNYGAYALNDGYSQLVWNDPQSYSYVNAICYQSMRISDAQGLITTCNITLAGSLSGTAPCFNVGLFSLDGTLLGSTGLVFPANGEELLNVNMTPVATDSLIIKRNTRYIIQLWSCGCQFAGYSRGQTYNYTYDFTLRQNLQTHTNSANWTSINSNSFNRIEVIPYISFGASEL